MMEELNDEKKSLNENEWILIEMNRFALSGSSCECIIFDWFYIYFI